MHPNPTSLSTIRYRGANVFFNKMRILREDFLNAHTVGQQIEKQ